jgi:hypothetical protein
VTDDVFEYFSQGNEVIAIERAGGWTASRVADEHAAPMFCTNEAVGSQLLDRCANRHASDTEMLDQLSLGGKPVPIPVPAIADCRT